MAKDSVNISVNRYHKKAYNQLALRYRKEDPVLDMLDVASEKLEVTKAQYVKNSLMAQFERDGITEEMIPEEKRRYEKSEVNDYVLLKTLLGDIYRIKVSLSKIDNTLIATLTRDGRIYTHSEQTEALVDGRYFNLVRPLGENYNAYLSLEMSPMDGSSDKLILRLDGSNIRKLRMCCDSVFEQE